MAVCAADPLVRVGLLAELRKSVGIELVDEQALAPRDLTLSGLTHRETDVPRLLAEGLDTAGIAANWPIRNAR